MTDSGSRIAAIFAENRSRLHNFIRRRVPDSADVEDILQEVFYRLVQANSLLMPIEHVTAWLYRVARNSITDLFRKTKPQSFSELDTTDDAGHLLRFEDLLPDSGAGPDSLYLRHLLLDQLAAALSELPPEQRDLFIAHEMDGRSFRQLAAESGVNINTLLSRKRYAVLHLRRRLQRVYEEFTGREPARK